MNAFTPAVHSPPANTAILRTGSKFGILTTSRTNDGGTNPASQRATPQIR